MNRLFSAFTLDIKSYLYFFSLVFLTFLYAGKGSVFWWGTPAICLLVVGVFSYFKDKQNLSLLAISVCVYSLAMLINIVFINPTFHVEGAYFLSFLALAFLLGRNLERPHLMIFYKITLLCFVFLALWGLFQYFTGQGFINFQANRANTVYTTPNSFAAAINLVLLPLLIYRFSLAEKQKSDVLILLLIVALFTSQSRGGWIAFTGGFSIGLIFLALSKNLKLTKANLFLIVKALVLILCLSIYHQSDTQQSLITRNSLDNTGEQTVQFSSIGHRLHFYKIAWEQFLEKPILGNGYFNYKYFLNRDNPIDLAKKGTTHFVHNDYLQHLLETGLIGFSALAFLILAFFYQAWRSYKRVLETEKIFIIAILASCCAYFIHALGDFVFYPAGITLFFGITLGYFDRITQKQLCLYEFTFPKTKLIKLLKPTLAIILICVFITPVIARLYALQADAAIDKKEYTASMIAAKHAQKFAPFEAYYVYQEARLWLAAVNAQQTREAASMADALLLKTIYLNPFEKYSLLERSKLHRDFPHLLETPENINQILAWQEETLTWQSKIKNNVAQTEYIKTLKKAGREEEARALYLQFQQELMQSRGVQGLLNKIFNPEG